MELFKLLKHDCLRLSCLKIRFYESKIYFLQMNPNMHLKFIVSKNVISEFICYNIPEKKICKGEGYIGNTSTTFVQ